jgi:small subunit ribosomal protein S4e
MASSHLKRIVAPKTWPILRKTTKFIARPKPNGQKMELTLPVVVIMRDILRLVENSSQARRILRSKGVMVNGRNVYDTDSTVGFMDIMTVGGKGYRLVINQNNQLTLAPVSKDEDFIIQKIAGKSTQKTGKVQISCTSGRTLLVEKDSYKVGDSIQIGKDGKISGHYSLAPGASVLLTGGSHIGKSGTIESITGKVLVVMSGDEKIETAKTHAYVLGKGKSAITLR